MKLEHQLFLTFERSDVSSSHKVRLVEHLSDALRKWTASTRISPIFPIGKNHVAASRTFKDAQTLFFIGPVHPERILTWTSPDTRAWASLGLLNVLVTTKSAVEAKRIRTWTVENKVSFEEWKIKSGEVTEMSFSQSPSFHTKLLRSLSEVSQRSLPAELSEAVHEYCPLMAATMTRCSSSIPDMLPDLVEIQGYVSDLLQTAPNEDTEAEGGGLFGILGQLLVVNAGLSRFSSQTFAGTIPVSATECHFWSNSLLGIGVPTIALWKLNGFIELTLGAARLPARFRKLRNVRKDVPDLTRVSINDPFWTTDHLGQVKLATADADPIVPLLTYFSGRDGFKSTPTTLSAPLACINSCNSLRWSLLTLTHEMSHTVVRSVTSEIYPNLTLKSKQKKEEL